MYDLHCHLLPGVDDGPADWETTMAMARALVDDGVTTVAATPHGPGAFSGLRYDPMLLQERVVELRERLEAAQLNLHVVLGTEIVFDVDLPARLKAGALLPYGHSRAILLETPVDLLPAALTKAIFDLQINGYRVLMAHPERTRSVQDDPNMLIPLVERGVLMQITAGSLAGVHGPRLQQIAQRLLIHGLGHVLASDAHHPLGHRAPCMRAGLAAAEALVGAAQARHLVETTPHLLLSDGPLPAFDPQPVTVARQRWWMRRS
jgi:protein-tyrosine phosphatase